MSSKVKVAVVGASGYGDSYLQTLLHDPRNSAIEFVGVADPAPQRCRRFELLKSRGIPFYPSLEVMLAEHAGNHVIGGGSGGGRGGTNGGSGGAGSGIDLVALATPIHLHAPHTCLALARGANVLCEKPLAGSLADARRMLHATFENEANFLAIGFQWSYSAAVQNLKRDIAANLFGRPLRLKCMVSFPRGHDYYGRNDWAGRVRTLSGKDVLDSPVNNSTAHYLHNMLYVLGPTRDSSATPATIQAELYRANSIENYDTGALRIHTDEGTEILFLSTQAMTQRVGPLSTYEFENATITHDSTTGSGEFVAAFHKGPHAGSTLNYGNPDADRNEKLWQSVATIQSGLASAAADSNTPACGIRSALAHTLCVLAAHKSCPTIRTIPPSELLSATVGDDIIVTVKDLSQIFRQCYDAARLPSELNISWSQPTSIVEVPHTHLLSPTYRPEEAAIA